MSSFLKSIERNKNFIQFGGQGVPWIKELRNLYRSNVEMKHFFETVFSTLEEEHTRFKNKSIFPQGFDCHSWLENEESSPDNNYLSIAPISLPMIFVTQIAHLENLHTKNIHRDKILDSTVALTGHSQGLITAVFVALNHKGSKFYETLSKFIKYMYYIGIRAQEASPSLFPSEKQKQDSLDLGIKDLSPMVAVLGSSHHKIQDQIDIFNQTVDSSNKIYIGLLNTASNHILCSTYESLIKFSQQIKEQIDSKELKYVYLKTTCPFHSPLLNDMLTPFLNDCSAIKFDYKGSDLQLPVYSFINQSNLQESNDLAETLCKALMMQQLDWSKALIPLKKYSFETVLDFGPGKVSQRLSLDVFSEIGLLKQDSILAVTVLRDLNVILSN